MSSRVVAPKAYSSATPRAISCCAQPIPSDAASSSITVTRLLTNPGVGVHQRGELRVFLAGDHHELESEATSVARLQRGRRPLGDQPALVDHRQPVDRLLRLHDVVGDQEDGGSLVAEPADLLPQQPAPQRVDVIGGLVEDDHPTGPNRHHHESDQTAHPAGELGPDRVTPLFELQLLDQLLAASSDGLVGTAADQPSEVDRLPAA